ncbi:MAG TPA: hypothetical protein VMT52_19185, partial [Planctomycetota bacterium]|nr:hypothetical protein [Planctomycetota bacterium]
QGLEAAAGGGWKAGTARARITPWKSMWLAGCRKRDRTSDGTLHHLWVKVLALEDGSGQRVVLVTSDTLGFPRRMVESACAAIGKASGIERHRILFSASGTRSGPLIRDILPDHHVLEPNQLDFIEEYSRALERVMVAMALKALSALEPCTIWTGEGATALGPGQGAGVARSARVFPVPVLVVRGMDEGIRAIAFAFPWPNTVLDGYVWSGDYSSYAQLQLEASYPGSQAMFSSGCGADLDTPHPLAAGAPEGGRSESPAVTVKRYGDTLAVAVDSVIRGPMRSVAPRLRTAMEIVPLPFERSPTDDELHAAVSEGGVRGRWGSRLLREISEGKPLAVEHPYPVQAWRIGSDQIWVAIAGDVPPELAAALRVKHGAKTWVTSLANDIVGPMPWRRGRESAAARGEILHESGLPAEQWSRDVEDRILSAVDRVVRRARAP